MKSVAGVDLNEVIASHCEQLGEDNVKSLFFGGHAHTSPAGANLNAEAVVEGLRGMKDCPVCAFMK
jgi:rhamnogalacturonan acetylesterase